MLIDKGSASFSNPTGFIVLEGVNGAGKSTVQRRIAQFLAAAGQEYLLTREPGGTPFGEQMRAILLGQHDRKINPRSEVFLFSADRAHHVSELIRPALLAKKAVVCDRFYYSTIAFQGYGRGLDRSALEQISYFAIDNCKPDLVILLDLAPSEGLRRTAKRSSQNVERDSFEAEKLEFHTRLRAGFLDMAKRMLENFLCVDAAKNEEAVWAEIEPVLTVWLDALRSHRGPPNA